MLISAVIVAAFAFAGRHFIDAVEVREIVFRNGIDSMVDYAGVTLFLTFVNSLMEEYVWRWFVFVQWERITGGRGRGWPAVFLSAACFTIHHVFVLGAQFGLVVTVMGSAGVFVGGVVWSWCYLRYRSIWPAYISHAIVDLAVLAVGWVIVFGGAG